MRLDISGSYLYIFSQPQHPYRDVDAYVPRQAYRLKKVFSLHALTGVEVSVTMMSIHLHFQGIAYPITLPFYTQDSFDRNFQVLLQGLEMLGMDRTYLSY